jgi:hypothetical protein
LEKLKVADTLPGDSVNYMSGLTGEEYLKNFY